MRVFLVILALAGAFLALLAFQSSSPTGSDLFNVTDEWDCGVVSRSSYAHIGPLPVSVIGIAGYLALAALALTNRKGELATAAVLGLAFSVYLSHLEKTVLRVWCQYCVLSQIAILALTLCAALWWWMGRYADQAGIED